MRLLLSIGLIITSSLALKAQIIPGLITSNSIRPAFMKPVSLGNNLQYKKWSLQKYSAISADFVFFKASNASIISVPVGLKLTRSLTNNLYAFAGVSAAPAFINFNQAFIPKDITKQNKYNFNANSLGIYSRAEIGLMYMNDAKTFSISGSVGIEKNNYSFPLYNHPDFIMPKPVTPVNNK